uniref:SAM domain-containing protein n=1 Tax=Zooxanthella nutricula TaxID=1333877 RepID=A0A7S2QQL6_9DINO
MGTFIDQNRCVPSNVADLGEQQCATVHVPLHGMGGKLGTPMGVEYSWANDTVEVYGYLFLWMTFWMWIMITVHDLALLTVNNRDYILDLRGIKRVFPCWRKLYILLGFRCWKRMACGGGILVARRRFLQKPMRIVSVICAPVFLLWAIIAFLVVVLPVVSTFFVIYPVRLSRAVIFVNCLSSAIFGLVLTFHCIAFVSRVDRRQIYAVTWSAGGQDASPCVCGCMYPLSGGTCSTLLLIGAAVAYKSSILAFRCLKGLRRSNWANLLSILFPIPLTAYEVAWTRPDGQPIQRRKTGEPVQGEPAFDPFALMDEQPNSQRTTVAFMPVAIEPEYEPSNWAAEDVEAYLEALGLEEYATQARSRGVDGPALLGLLREVPADGVGGLAELGVADRRHARMIRSQLGLVKPKSVSGLLTDPSAVSGHAAREMLGPRYKSRSLDPAALRGRPRSRAEYIGCCGFPCVRGENGAGLPDEDESDGEGEHEVSDAGRADKVEL